ncbi:hypothetical protein DL765_003085 [Monosporascus sp. GIB2]|nr:hypothetical protein DL765_003085 [Monosporascus sp. GIB2]
MGPNAVFYPWYRGDDQHKTAVANDAFKAVKEHFEQSNGLSDQERALVASASRIEDVLQVVNDSLAKYEAKSESSKTRKWLQKASETICHYGTFLDVFVQHHPDFTRPHELRYNDLLERVTDCSNNIVELAAVGSQAEIHVMHKTQARKLNDIISTLKVADQDRKNQLDGLTHIVSRLEASDRKQEKRLDLIISLLEASGLTINDLLAKTQKLQLSQALSTFSLTFEDPGKCYEHHLFFRNRRASGMGASTSTNTFWLSPNLARWSSSHEPSLAIIKGAFPSRLAMLDFGVDVIQTLTASVVPTVWALTSVEKSGSNSISTTTDLMKYLTYQALRLSGAVRTEKQMASRYSQLHTARTPTEWLELFKQVIANLGGEVYIIADLAAVRSPLEGADGFNFIQELSRMLGDVSKHGMETVVKVLLLVYEADWFRLLPNGVSRNITPVKAMRSKRPQCKEMRHAGVNAGTNARNGGDIPETTSSADFHLSNSRVGWMQVFKEPRNLK